MYVEEVLAEYRKGNIRDGDTVTLTGLWYVEHMLSPAPWYFCCEEQYYYRTDLTGNEPGARHATSQSMDDAIGTYHNSAHYLCSLGTSRCNLISALLLNEIDTTIHLISFGLDFAFGEFISLAGGAASFSADLFTVTGKIMVPKNADETPIAIGVGFFEYMRYNMEGVPSEFYEILRQERYDDRPVIDLTRFSEKFQQVKIQQVLKRTGMNYDDFHWILEQEPMIPGPGSLEFGDFWIRSKALQEYTDPAPDLE